MSKPYKGFEPKWVKEAAPTDSWRSVFRWGDPGFCKISKRISLQNDERKI